MSNSDNFSRRNFIKTSALSGSGLLFSDKLTGTNKVSEESKLPIPVPLSPNHHSILNPIDLSPARWIWYPMQRCLANTVILFRKTIKLNNNPKKALGYILADSRYKLTINGARVQWGPAPCDPRWMEADPMDISKYLVKGDNVIACSVLYFGLGDGTSPMGKPGFIFKLDIEMPDRSAFQIISDESWLSHLARSWKPGNYKRWFLRSFQEEFDARMYPHGWDLPEFVPDDNWLASKIYGSNGDKPTVCNGTPEYMWEISGKKEICSLRERSVPLLQETSIDGFTLRESAWIYWKRPAEEYFESITPNAFDFEWGTTAKEINNGEWEIEVRNEKAASLTFAHQEQMVGWPNFTIDAPEGTIVEILVHEAHKPGGPVFLNTHFHSWTRFICKEGENNFETFDFESYRWIQFHIRNYNRSVKLKNISIRRRMYPWKHNPEIVTNDQVLQRVIDASVNTLYNCAQETIVDGMARERQQYSGDGSHQLHAIYYSFSDTLLPARFVNTFGQGLGTDDVFMDSWPAFDRLARVMERQMQLTGWGPIVDHSVGFCFDSWYYYLYTGEKDALKETYPRLLRFFSFLKNLIGKVTLTGFEPEQFVLEKMIVLDSLLINKLKIDQNISKPKIDSGKKKKQELPAMQINYLLVNSDGISISNNGTPKLYLGKSEVRLWDLKLPDRMKSNSMIPRFDNLIFTAQKGLLFGKKENHLLSVNQVLLNTEKEELRVKKILLEPLNQDGDHSKFNIQVPDLIIDQLKIKQWLLDSTLQFNSIRFSEPKVRMDLVAKRNTEIKKKIELDSIQLPLVNIFKEIDGNRFDVVNGSVSISTINNNDAVEYGAKNMNFSLESIQWRPGDLMFDTNLLFSEKTSIQVDYFTYHKPGKKEFVNINHFQASDDPNLLRAEGIYFSSNTGPALIDEFKLKVELQDFQIHGLNYLKLIHGEEFITNEIQLIKPIVSYQKIAGPKTAETGVLEDKQAKDGITPLRILAGNLMIKDGRFEFISTNEKGTGNLKLPHVDLNVSNLHLEPGSVQYKNTNELANQIQLDIRNASYLMPGNLNTLRIESISSDINNEELKIRNFELQPNVSKYEYGPLKGFQTDWVSLRNKDIVFNNFDYNKLIFDKKIQLQSIEVNGLTVNLLRDKRVPFPEDQYRGMPQEMLRRIPLPIRIDTIYLNDLAITYQEHGVKSHAPGEVFFSDLYGRLINVTNDSEALKNQPKMFMEARGKLMGTGQIKAEFMFDMVDPLSSHSFGATVGPFDLTEFNRMLIPTAFVQVKSGVNNGIIMNLKGNDDYSYGEMKFYYENLKIQLLDKETELPKGMGNAMVSFFANTFFINTNNPRLLIFRKGDIFFERDKSKSIFNYWSKSFLSGIVSSIGAKNNKKKIKKARETELEKYDSSITQSPTK